MATIDIKLKSYDELIFEITKLNTDKYLLEQENKQLKEDKKKAIEYIKENKEHRFAMNFEYGLNEEELEKLLAILGDKENEKH